VFAVITGAMVIVLADFLPYGIVTEDCMIIHACSTMYVYFYVT
jgi:hypothetical protein